MALESVNHISDLVATNPDGQVDFIEKGDDHLRNIKKALKTDLPGIDGPVQATDTDLAATAYLVDSGSANALQVAPAPAWTEYSAGCGVWVKVAAANSGPATINVSGLGVQAIRRPDGSDLQAGDLLAGAVVALRYDGSAFQLAAGQPALTLAQAQRTYLPHAGMQTRALNNVTGGTGQWFRVARIQHRNPIDEAEGANFTGTAYVQSDYGYSRRFQSVFQFSFGSRDNAGLAAWFPLCVNLGEGGGRFAIYREADGWHYLWFYQDIFSRFAVFQYFNQDCTEFWTAEAAPVGTRVWDSTQDWAQALHVGRSIVWDDRSAAPEDEQLVPLINGWTHYGQGWRPATFCKDRFGWVQLAGLIRGGGNGLGTVLFNLPPGYRPIEGLIFTCPALSGWTDLRVMANGDVTLGYNAVISNEWLSLAPVRFRAYQ